MSYAAVAKVLLLDDDTIRTWRLLYEQDGIEGLANFGYDGSACRLNNEQQAKLVTWITAEFGIEYQSRSGLIALLHRLGMEHSKAKAISCKQAVFIMAYENLLNQLEADETEIFADAVHPTHAVQLVGCWAPKDGPDYHEGCADGGCREHHIAADGDRSQCIPRMRLVHVFVDNARYHHAKLVQA